MTNKPAALSSDLFEAVLAALPVALTVYDGNHRLVLASHAAFAWAGLNPRVLPAGSSFAEVLRIMAWNGMYGPGDPDQIARSVLSLDRSRPHSRMVRSSGGRIGLVESQPLPGGGFMTCTSDVTALSQAGADSADRARLLESVLARLQTGVAGFDATLRLQVSNPAFDLTLGLPSGLVRPGMTDEDLLDQLRRPGEMEVAERDDLIANLAEGRVQTGTHQRTRPTGEVHQVSRQALPQGGFMIEVTEVTALKRAEDEARRRAAMLVGVLEALPHGVCMFGPDRRVAMVNQAYGRIMQGSPVQLGDLLDDLATRREAEGEFTAAQAELVRRRPTDGGDGGLMLHLRPNGTAVESRIAPLPDGGHISVLTDVTALHRAQAESRRRAAMMEAMLSAIGQGIVLYGPDRRLLAANGKVPGMIGLPAESMTPGRSIDDVVADQIALGVISHEAGTRILTFDRRQSKRYRRSTREGRVIEVNSDPTPDGGFAITFTDVSEDYRIRDELERAGRAAEAASEAKSRFLATMSHELRTPLNAIIGFSEVLTAERDRSGIEDCAQAINDAGRKLLLLINDILDVAKSQTGALEITEAAVAIAPLLEQAGARIAEQARQAGQVFEIEVPGGLPALRADADRLAQLLDNLLSNAMKFTPSGGRIVLSARLERDGLAICVADSGIGIGPQDQERVFEPFTQVDDSLARRFQGSGLGLYLARTLAGALGGTLGLEAPQGPGTLVVLRFPPGRLIGFSSGNDATRGDDPAAEAPYPAQPTAKDLP